LQFWVKALWEVVLIQHIKNIFSRRSKNMRRARLIDHLNPKEQQQSYRSYSPEKAGQCLSLGPISFVSKWWPIYNRCQHVFATYEERNKASVFITEGIYSWKRLLGHHCCGCKWSWVLLLDSCVLSPNSLA